MRVGRSRFGWQSGETDEVDPKACRTVKHFAFCLRWLTNRAENSQQPFRRRERAMIRFRSMRTLQKFVAVHASIHNHFNQERHLYSRAHFKLNRTAAPAEWRQLGVA